MDKPELQVTLWIRFLGLTLRLFNSPVSDEYYELLLPFSTYLSSCPRTIVSLKFIFCNLSDEIDHIHTNKLTSLLIHRLVTGAAPGTFYRAGAVGESARPGARAELCFWRKAVRT